MEAIKPGTIAYIRTTEEPCFVLGVKDISGPHVLGNFLSGTEAIVRRPNFTEKGSIIHTIEHFFLEELETKDDNTARKLAELEGLRAKFPGSKHSSATGNLAGSN